MCDPCSRQWDKTLLVLLLYVVPGTHAILEGMKEQNLNTKSTNPIHTIYRCRNYKTRSNHCLQCPPKIPPAISANNAVQLCYINTHVHKSVQICWSSNFTFFLWSCGILKFKHKTRQWSNNPLNRNNKRSAKKKNG